MGVLDDAINRAAQQEASKPLPQSAPARMRHLVEHIGNAAATARALGTSPTTVRRYMRGQSTTPRPDLATALEGELQRHWQPGLQRRALTRGKNSGFTVVVRATFGFGPKGTSDEARLRLITQHIPPYTARTILEAREHGASEEDLLEALEEALAHHYFRDGGRRAHGLNVKLRDIDYIDVGL